ncbi:MAG: hypothetical protein KDK70_10450 [Myxococcales bacterium]|nr:hypothetical protein [Myxococcales bacterium]
MAGSVVDLPTPSQWTTLEGATLVYLQLDWTSGKLRMTLRGDGGPSERVKIEATNLYSLQCPRRFPWGESIEVAEIRRPVMTNEGFMLEIQMASGDLLVLIAERFELDTSGVR